MQALQALSNNIMETYFSLEAGFADLDGASAFKEGEFVYLLGECFLSDKVDDIKAFSTSRLWFTYRKNFAAIGGTDLTSDQGWGCMLRCGQMLLAQTLSVIHLGRSWTWERNSTDESYRRLLKMFQDKRTSLYSLHQIAKMGVSEKKEVGQWFGPNTVAQVLKKLVVYDNWSQLAIHVAMDSILISDDVKAMAYARPPSTYLEDISTPRAVEEEEKTWRPLLIIVPLRLGLTVINKCYLTAIQEYFKLPQCMGILGGRPNHAVYFYGVSNDKMLYLDPHVCQDAINIDNDSYETIPSNQDCSEISSKPISSCQSHASQTSMEYVSNPANDVTSTTSSPPPISTPEDPEVDATPTTALPEPLSDSEGIDDTSPGRSSATSPSFDPFDDSSYHCPYLMHMDFETLDPSLALSFLCTCEDDYTDLVQRLPEILNASKPPLFDLLEKRPFGFPKFVPYTDFNDSKNINEVNEFEDFGDSKFNSDEEFEVLS
uniref:Cysteine protease n=1 Tax=Panagrellus redivivus TaxID=6233 RepID=A0A7E4VLZ9_PANRE